MEKQVFISLDGGVLQGVSVSEDLADIEITVIDYDIEGWEGEIDKTLDGEDAIINIEPTNVIGDGGLKFWEKILKIRKG